MPLDAKEYEELHKKIKADTEEAFTKADAKLQEMVAAKVSDAVAKATTGSISKEEMEKKVKEAADEYSIKASELDQKLQQQGDVLRGLKDRIDVQQADKSI